MQPASSIWKPSEARINATALLLWVHETHQQSLYHGPSKRHCCQINLYAMCRQGCSSIINVNAGHEHSWRPDMSQSLFRRSENNFAIRWRFLRNLFHFSNNFLKVHFGLLSWLIGSRRHWCYLCTYIGYTESQPYTWECICLSLCVFLGGNVNLACTHSMYDSQCLF